MSAKAKAAKPPALSHLKQLRLQREAETAAVVVKARPCLGPSDIPAHDYPHSTPETRICPACRERIATRTRGVSPRMYEPCCGPGEE